MIQVTNIAKSYGTRELFSGVTFSVNPGERVGLVGRNGSGKSTLLRVLLGEEGHDEGEVQISKGYRIGSLSQYFQWTLPTIVDECMTALPKELEHERYRAEKILFGLGFEKEDLLKPASSFSGGYQLRINLAKLILSEPHLIFLDEPTNYLDILSVRWLQGFLRSFPGEAIIITHDRTFMDSVCTHIMGINRGKLKKIPGKTSYYYEQMALEDEIYEKTRLNQEKKAKEIQQFIDRFKAKASKARQAQSKVKRLEKMDVLQERSDEKVMRLNFRYQPTHAKFLLEVKDLTFAYPDQKSSVIENFCFTLGAHDRVGIIGKNGKGKSTLLNLLAGHLKPTSTNSSCQWHPSAIWSHFGQTNVESLYPENTIEQEVQASGPDLSYSHIRAICGSMLFSGDDALKKIKLLSGGEKSRVMLGKVMASTCNVLLLDEPTNHLDMESIDELSEQIDEFEGALIFVSHSEDFLNRHATKLIYFDENKIQYFDGSYKEFLKKVGWSDENYASVKGPSTKKSDKKKSKGKSRSNSIDNESFDIDKQTDKKIKAIEQDIAHCEQTLEEANNRMIKASEKSDGDEIMKVSAEIKSINDKMERLYQELADLFQ